MLSEICQKLLIVDHLLAHGTIFTLLLCLFILVNQFLLADVGLHILSSWLMVCLSLAIGCILGLFEKFDISCECLL